MFNCAELDVENLSDNDRVRLLEQIDDDMIHLNLTNGGSLPPDAVAKKRQLLEDAARDINVYGPRVVSAIRR